MDDDETAGRGGEGGSDNTGNSESRPLDPATRDQPRETTARVLASLTPDERRVLRSRFALGENSRRTVEQVDRQFSVTLDRIRQIEEKALRKLGYLE